MNFFKFFVDYPISADMLSMLILLIGIISIWRLPISEYPEVVPLSVVVHAQFSGVNPKVIAGTAASPLEEQINGVENISYIQSQANNDGNMTTTVTFKLGIDPDRTQRLVQNHVSQALPCPPDTVQRLGMTTIKSSPGLTMVMHLLSPNNRYDVTYLRNYIVLNVKDRLTRISDVSQVQLFGSGDYSTHMWLDPNRVVERGLMANEVIKAIRNQSVQVAIGVIGGPSLMPGTDLQLSVSAQGRLRTEQRFGDIILKGSPDGAITHLHDMARTELAASEYGLCSLLDNKQAVAVPIFQAPGSNALQISDNVRKTMTELKKDFPEGVDYCTVYDPMQFARSSTGAATHTLLEAVTLVVFVVILFPQMWRASIIPPLTVPVPIIGVSDLMLMFGFSINVLSLSRLALAIGIVADDTIVVTENVERNVAGRLSPREAMYKVIREVSGSIIVIALTLIAVFMSLAFMTSLIGQFYKQSALTISASTVISTFNSLALSSTLVTSLPESHDASKGWLARAVDKGSGWIFHPFNRMFGVASESYGCNTLCVIDRKTAMLGIHPVLIDATALLFNKIPGGFVPMQDEQYLVSFTQLPDGASLDRTEDVARRISDITPKHPGVESTATFPGLPINGFTNSPSAGIVPVTFRPSDQRKDANLLGGAIAGQLNQQYGAIRDAFIAISPPPSVQSLGTVGGLKMQIENRGSVGCEQLFIATQASMARARQTPELGLSPSSCQINVLQLNANLDRTKTKQLGVSATDVFDIMQVYLGLLCVNDFNHFSHTYQVKVQADAPLHAHVGDIPQLKTCNIAGEMVPLSSLLCVLQGFGPGVAMRYNGYAVINTNGGPAPGFSSNQA